jgi:pimeloyl-ACP methyl ester carboxylesterase
VATFLGFEKFHIFGWNGGTQIAMRCAVNFADHIQSCILLDPFFELADMRKVNKAIEFKRVLFEHPQRELYAYYWVMAGLSSGFIGQHFDQVEKMVAARMKGDKFVKTDPDVFINWVRALRRNWITDEEFGRIRAPTLVMATELDNWHAGHRRCRWPVRCVTGSQTLNYKSSRVSAVISWWRIPPSLWKLRSHLSDL